MPSRLIEIFEDKILVERIKRRLPYLFQLAELESSRAGKTGMEVGSVREKIVAALLIYKFGEANVETDIPITKSEIDTKLFGEPVSIKTKKGKDYSGVKISWTVDAQKSKEFQKIYYPHFDILFVQVAWGKESGFYWIPINVQKRLFDKIGRERYIQLPKPGTNPRGIEINKEALKNLVNDAETKKIMIYWQKIKIDFNPYKRWVDLWKEE